MNKKWIILLSLILIVAVGVALYFIVFKKSDLSTVGPNAEQTEDIFDDSTTSDNPSTPTSVSDSYALTISKLGVEAPVVLNVDGNNKEVYMKELESGVAHMQNTVLPGQIGNSVIFGHSSYYPDKPGSFKEIFATLNQLAANDLIQIKNGDNSYSYKVIDTKIVAPDDLSVLDQQSDQKMLTLITCWPLKTTTSRYVVVALAE